MSDQTFKCKCGYVMRSPFSRPIQPEEEAVIEAAKKWADAWGLGVLQKPGIVGVTKDLARAISALQPKAVRPEDCKPGTRFRFEIDAGSSPAIKMIYVTEALGIIDGYRWEGEDSFKAFNPDDLLIPIKESDQ